MMDMIGGEARLRYHFAGFEIIRAGTYVTCAVTGRRIPLADLRYWSVERQQAYASPEAVARAMAGDADA